MATSIMERSYVKKKVLPLSDKQVWGLNNIYMWLLVLLFIWNLLEQIVTQLNSTKKERFTANTNQALFLMFSIKKEFF